MKYAWRCKKCEWVVDIDRPLAQYKSGPTAEEARHQGCDGSEGDFTRILTIPSRIFVHEDEDVYFK